MNNFSIKYGVLGAMALIVAMLVLWFISPKSLLNWSSWAGLVIFIYSLYLTGKEAKWRNEGFISFGDMFKYMLLTSVVFAIIGVLFNHILFNVIDPGLADVQKEMAIEGIEKMRDMLGDIEGFDEAQEKIEEESFALTPTQSLISFVSYVVGGAIVAAIMAAIMKKKKPIDLA